MSLQIEPGQLALLVGSNGAGKSTTMKIVAGLARADAGSASICGNDIRKSRPAAQRALSYFPQNRNFIRGSTVSRC